MPKLPPNLKAHICFYIKSQPLAKNPQFCLSVGMGLGALTRALSPSFAAIFPKSQSADSASRSRAEMVNSQCCQCHTCCPNCATCLFPVYSLFICHIRAGGCPWGKAAQLPWAKANTGTGLQEVTTEGRAFGNVSLLLDATTIRGRTTGCSLHLLKCSWMKHPVNVELIPVAGGVYCADDPLIPRNCHVQFRRRKMCVGEPGKQPCRGTLHEGGHRGCLVGPEAAE